MNIKNLTRILLTLLCLFILTGCNIVYINDDDIEYNVDLILKNEIKVSNKDAIGYKYYLPTYMTVIDVNDFNQELYYNNKKFYLYTDIVSYYHKINKKYTINKNAYISKKLQYNNKNGYLEINKVDNKYYIEMMFNYAKVEAYVEKYDLVDSVTSISYVLSSIQYNDNVIESLLGKNKYDLGGNETYNIFETKKNTDGNFLDWVNEYDNYNGQNSAQSLIEKDEISTSKED